jgi:dCTP deaminase
MASGILTDIAASYLSTQLAKAKKLRSRVYQSQLQDFCNQIVEYLDSPHDIEDLEDLIALKESLSAVSEIMNLISLANPEKSSWWAFPLIRQCYELCKIDYKNRHILIIHTDMIEEFVVYPDITTFLPFIIKRPCGPIDVFTIPATSNFELSSIALVGHEVGHIYWTVHFDSIATTVGTWANGLDKYKGLDLFTSADVQEKTEVLSSRLEEHLCDHVGWYLFGPAYDVAFLKEFCSTRSESSNKKFSLDIERMQKAVERLKRVPIDFKLGTELGKTITGVVDQVALLVPEEQTCADDSPDAKLRRQIYDSFGPGSPCNHLNFELAWNQTKAELDGFRPPFEVVGSGAPIPINPVDAVVAAVFYYHSGVFTDTNDFYRSATHLSEKRRCDFIRKILIRHLQYAIELNGVYRRTECEQKNEEKPNWEKMAKETLWGWRARVEKGIKSPLIVVPTTDPVNQYNQSTVDLRLGPVFLVHRTTRYTHVSPKPTPVNSKCPEADLDDICERVVVPVSHDFVLHPHQFVLGSTLEYICLPHDYCALVLGRSSWGRLGLNIATATMVQAGYRGCLTLELRNLGESPLPLTVGLRIAQLLLVASDQVQTGAQYYSSKSKYVGPVEPKLPKIWKDEDWDLIARISQDDY